MQWHPLESGPFDPGHSRGAFLPGHLLETVGLGDRRAICDDFEERRADRDTDTARNLCGSGLSVRQAAPRGWFRLLSAGIALARAARLALRAKRAESARRSCRLDPAKATPSLLLPPPDNCSNNRRSPHRYPLG